MAITCDDPELHASSGSVSSMPGSSHALPNGAMCDVHPTVRAVARIQGETDSFGCEYHLMCQACLDENRKATREAYEAESFCDWCKTLKTHCAPRRDFEEGMGGPVYNVCRDCVNKENDRINEELEYQDEHYGPLDDDFDDDFDDDDFDDEPLEDWKVIDTTQIDDGGCCKVVAICWSEAEASIAIKNLGKESRENYVKMMDGLYHIDPPYAE